MSLLLTLAALAVLLPILLAGVSLAPWVPTRKGDLAQINHLANLQDGQTFLEIGCGTARVAKFIAQANPQARVIGIEMAWPLFLLAKCKSLLVKNLHIKLGNIFKKRFQQDFAKADVLFVFAMKGNLNGQLKDKICRDCSKSVKVISYVFPMRSWPGKLEKREGSLPIWVFHV